MLGIFEQTETDTALHPREDPEVIRLQAAVEGAQNPAAHAQEALRIYLAAHGEDVVRIPWPRQKQALADRRDETAQALEEAGHALRQALEAATATARAAWDDRIREQFLDDLPAIEAFIAVLERHEATPIEAQAAGVAHTLHVPSVFLTAAEVRARLAYAQQQLGIE